MENQEMEMKRKLEMETGNGNWKWKQEQKKTHQSLVLCLLHIVLGHYSCILLSNGYRTGFTSHVLWLYSCTVLCDDCFWVALMWQTMLQSSLVHMWEGLGMRLVTMRVTYIVLHSYSCSLVPRPTSSFDCVKQIMASYPGLIWVQ